MYPDFSAKFSGKIQKFRSKINFFSIFFVKNGQNWKKLTSPCNFSSNNTSSEKMKKNLGDTVRTLTDTMVTNANFKFTCSS